MYDPRRRGRATFVADTPTTSDPTANAEKAPETWLTGQEPMTGPQASYLATLANDTGREIPERLTKAEASKLIDELRSESGRVRGSEPQG